MSSGVLAQYETLHGTVAAIEKLRAAGHTDLEVFSPIPAPEIEEAMDIHSSPVRLWALVGGITGCVTGLLLTSGDVAGVSAHHAGKADRLAARRS